MLKRSYTHQRENVTNIRIMYRAGYTFRELADIWGGHFTNHHLIVRRKTWKKER